MNVDFVTALDRVRADALARGIADDDAQLGAALRAGLAGVAHYPPARALLEALRDGRDSTPLLRMSETTHRDMLFGFFDIPYNPAAWMEAAAIRHIATPDRFADDLACSKARPVVVTAATEGFRSPLMVAAFCENFNKVVPQDSYKAYYFVDRFVARTQAYTLPEIRRAWSPTAFPALCDAGQEDLYSASALWVHMHEAYHRKGFLPIPAHLSEKSTRNGGGAEEMRVDLLTCIALGRRMEGDPEAELAFQYVLAERLIRYPLQSAPAANYDARASVALFNYLMKRGVIARRRGRFYFEGGTARLLQALVSLAVRITSFEYRVSQSAADTRRAALSDILPRIAGNDDHWPTTERYLEGEFHA